MYPEARRLQPVGDSLGGVRSTVGALSFIIADQYVCGRPEALYAKGPGPHQSATVLKSISADVVREVRTIAAAIDAAVGADFVTATRTIYPVVST